MTRDQVESTLRKQLSRVTGCSPLDVQAIPGRNERVEITLTVEQAIALARILPEVR